MKKLIYALLFAVLFSCGNEKVLQLPEISHSKITEIKDVSHAYLFYDETQTDSVDLNRKNLISTTNWLINVDKRLTLKQVIPHIKYLQEKKANSSHKKEGIKNYFTCNDTSKKNLGFIEFTTIKYKTKQPKIFFSDISSFEHSKNIYSVNFGINEEISILLSDQTNIIIKTNETSIKEEIRKLDITMGRIILNFHEDTNFQDYTSYKSLLSTIDLNHLSISNQEFLHN